MLATRFASSSSPMNAARAIARSSINPTHTRNLHLGRQRSALASSSLRQLSKSGSVFAGTQSRTFFWGSDAPKVNPSAEIPAVDLTQKDKVANAIAENTGYVNPNHQIWPGTIPEEHIYDVAAEVAKSTTVGPEQFGYLKSLGIDFGFGPSGVMQYIFEYIHVVTGFGWGGSILATVLVVRMLQFPFYCKMSHHSALLKEIAPLTQQATEKMRKCKNKNDLAGMVRARREIAQISKDVGSKPMWLAFPITQIPIFYGMFQNLKAMTNLPVPAFLNDGFLHFQNLALPDPYMILPTLCSATVMTTMLMGGEAGANNLSRKMKLMMGFGFPIMCFFIYKSWGAGLVLYFAANGAWGLGQSILFRNEKFRAWWGIHPLNKGVVLNPLGPVKELKIDPAVAEHLAKIRGEKKKGEAVVKDDKSKVDKFFDYIGDKIYGKVEPGTYQPKAGIDKFIANHKSRADEAEHLKYEKQRQKKMEEQKKERDLARLRRQRMRQIGITE